VALTWRLPSGAITLNTCPALTPSGTRTAAQDKQRRECERSYRYCQVNEQRSYVTAQLTRNQIFSFVPRGERCRQEIVIVAAGHVILLRPTLPGGLVADSNTIRIGFPAIDALFRR